MSRLEQLHKLHAADPRDPFCTYGIALEHAKTHDFDEAIRWLDKTLAADPNYCYAYFQKAKMLAEKGDEAGARDVLNTGIATARKLGNPDANHAAEEMATLLESFS